MPVNKKKEKEPFGVPIEGDKKKQVGYVMNFDEYPFGFISESDLASMKVAPEDVLGKKKVKKPINSTCIPR